MGVVVMVWMGVSIVFDAMLSGQSLGVRYCLVRLAVEWQVCQTYIGRISLTADPAGVRAF